MQLKEYQSNLKPVTTMLKHEGNTQPVLNPACHIPVFGSAPFPLASNTPLAGPAKARAPCGLS